jgi:hypothetical protein
MVTIGDKEYKVYFKTIGKEVAVIVQDFDFDEVRGHAGDGFTAIEHAKHCFKLQVEKAKDVEVTWG